MNDRLLLKRAVILMAIIEALALIPAVVILILQRFH